MRRSPSSSSSSSCDLSTIVGIHFFSTGDLGWMGGALRFFASAATVLRGCLPALVVDGEATGEAEAGALASPRQCRNFLGAGCEVSDVRDSVEAAARREEWRERVGPALVGRASGSGLTDVLGDCRRTREVGSRRCGSLGGESGVAEESTASALTRRGGETLRSTTLEAVATVVGAVGVTDDVGRAGFRSLATVSVASLFRDVGGLLGGVGRVVRRLRGLTGWTGSREGSMGSSARCVFDEAGGRT